MANAFHAIPEAACAAQCGSSHKFGHNVFPVQGNVPVIQGVDRVLHQVVRCYR